MVTSIGPVEITSQMITSVIITIIICGACIIAGRNMQMVPTGLQNIMEIVVFKLRNFYKDVMGEYSGGKYFAFCATFFIYVLLCNYSGLLPLSGHLPGLAAPTSSINFPLGMALIVFVATQALGMKEHGGLKFYKHLLKPVALIFPLMVIEEIVRPVSLTLRLYGNVFGEEAVTEAFFDILPFGLPIVMMALSVLMGLVQALVFSLLAGIYISGAVEHEEL